MRIFSSSVQRSAAILAAVVATVVPAGSSAHASAAERRIDIRGTAVCDAATHQWRVSWAVTNRSEVAGTLGNIRSEPAEPVLGLAGKRVQPGETVTGEQRLTWWQYTAYLAVDVNWDDAAVTYDHRWPIYIRTYCGPQ